MAIECQDVLFEDILEITVPPCRHCLFVDLDPAFVATCDPGSIVVTSALPDMPVRGLRVDMAPRGNHGLFIRLSPQLRALRIIITVHGTRRGHADARAKKWTEAQAARNAAFYARFHQPHASTP